MKSKYYLRIREGGLGQRMEVFKKRLFWFDKKMFYTSSYVFGYDKAYRQALDYLSMVRKDEEKV